LIGKKENCEQLRQVGEVGGTLIIEAGLGWFDERFYYKPVVPLDQNAVQATASYPDAVRCCLNGDCLLIALRLEVGPRLCISSSLNAHSSINKGLPSAAIYCQWKNFRPRD
jgi:hypothetical protein